MCPRSQPRREVSKRTGPQICLTPAALPTKAYSLWHNTPQLSLTSPRASTYTLCHPSWPQRREGLS